ncbi:MAG: DUF86 domain-containing protein [Candidatus Andersenbacteria bacterium CG10_big_fil_rev_8_21_14_0_10_54_11]|uniref:DUF86 domain-containing protein n=1 Tax=Candidatus Andersenbacteria bacterium CG10_big_fil_rev_8_21_14_0_10_54_11 TaxID=1974485 RepID=A0A2M6X0H7_9BACT|nr:MAG: DUF86 domain-containing protein [Candidatus Andersenbacteria bacterium CG10_big_fil_rev_8_21_14_0_10_54_11]
MAIVERYRKFSPREIEKDIDLRGAVERYLYLLAQATIDLGESLIAYKGYRKPATMCEVFQILHEEKIIDRALLESMVQMTGFRTIIAHDYADINYEVVHSILQQRLPDIEAFLAAARGIINA